MMKGVFVFVVLVVIVAWVWSPSENSVNTTSAMAKQDAEGEPGVAGKMREVVRQIKEADLVDTPKRAAEDIKRNISTKLGSVKEFLQRAVHGGTKEEVKGSKEVFPTDWKNLMLGVFHVFGFSMAFGMSIWMSLVYCYIVGVVLPRHRFALLQTKLYPTYYKIQAYCISMVFAAHFLSRGLSGFPTRWEVFNAVNIVAALFLSWGKVLYLEPLATRIMSKRQKLEKDAGRASVTTPPTSGIADDAGDPVSATTERQEEIEGEEETSKLSEKLKTVNMISSYVNMMTIMSLGVHLLYLGHMIGVTCLE